MSHNIANSAHLIWMMGKDHFPTILKLERYPHVAQLCQVLGVPKIKDFQRYLILQPFVYCPSLLPPERVYGRVKIRKNIFFFTKRGIKFSLFCFVFACLISIEENERASGQTEPDNTSVSPDNTSVSPFENKSDTIIT